MEESTQNHQALMWELKNKEKPSTVNREKAEIALSRRFVKEYPLFKKKRATV